MRKDTALTLQAASLGRVAADFHEPIWLKGVPTHYDGRRHLWAVVLDLPTRRGTERWSWVDLLALELRGKAVCQQREHLKTLAEAAKKGGVGNRLRRHRKRQPQPGTPEDGVGSSFDFQPSAQSTALGVGGSEGGATSKRAKARRRGSAGRANKATLHTETDDWVQSLDCFLRHASDILADHTRSGGRVDANTLTSLRESLMTLTSTVDEFILRQ